MNQYHQKIEDKFDFDMLLAILVSSVVDTSTYEIILEYIDSHVTFYMHCAQFSNVELCLKIRKYPNTSTIILNRYIYRCSSKKNRNHNQTVEVVYLQ